MCVQAPSVRTRSLARPLTHSLTHTRTLTLVLFCCDSATEQHHRALRHCTVCRRTPSGFSVVAPIRKALRPLVVPLRAFPHHVTGAEASGRGLRPDVTWSSTTSALRSSSSLGVHGNRRFQRLRFFPRSLLPEEHVLSIVLLHIFVGFVRTWIRSCPLNRRVVNCIRPSTLRLTLRYVFRDVSSGSSPHGNCMCRV